MSKQMEQGASVASKGKPLLKVREGVDISEC